MKYVSVGRQSSDGVTGCRNQLYRGPFWLRANVVLRRKPGDQFLAIDGSSGLQHLVQIDEVGDSTASGTIVESSAAVAPTRLKLTLYQGIPRGKRFPLILQKCTELGVSRIVPVLTERTVVRVDEDAGHKQQRWSRIVQEAARQCMLGKPPEVGEPLDFAAALADWQASGTPGLFFDEALSSGVRTGLAHALTAHRSAPGIAAFVGPEGGFTQDEAETAAAAGLTALGLGERILRSETAAIAVCAVIMYEAGQLG
jgi:16S rRNA (uracil1498-N3)-methyltransferase